VAPPIVARPGFDDRVMARIRATPHNRHDFAQVWWHMTAQALAGAIVAVLVASSLGSAMARGPGSHNRVTEATVEAAGVVSEGSRTSWNAEQSPRWSWPWLPSSRSSDNPNCDEC
jgi:hypothetical protein